MYKNEGYMAGANLGHWISQYGTKSHDHFSNYITEGDITRIAQWGMDHVRLPVDYFIFEDNSAPGVYKEDGLVYIDRCIEWCKKNGLNLVLDLHHAPGFFFGDGDKNCLFFDRNMQQRYIDIWKFFTKRYISEKYNVTFELLNELVLPQGSAAWNDLWQETAAEIHLIDPERNIIVGGNFYNSVGELKNLVISNNPHIWYTFHCYHPMIFTHQRAGWMENTRRYRVPVEYPVDTELHAEFYNNNIPESEKGILDRLYLKKILQPAFDFIEKNNKPLYCGEYGVIANASVDSTVSWLNDITDLLLEYGIGRAVWSYRGFSCITDSNNNITSDSIIKAISRK
ncbi:MAG: cellulase family glycosylhydrolase [Eubacteriales bacterium]|jgi:endoglucanase|nr:cellulase family glycosylhydrolase [Eubacteriales bacterium]